MKRQLLMIGLAGLLAAGCMMKPKGASEQEAQLEKAGEPYQKAFEQRVLPEVPTPATWQDVLHRAFLANGDLEAKYHEWRAANERVGIASYWPNSNITLGFDYMFSKAKMKAWDRTTVSAAFDSSKPLELPMKTQQKGKAALEEARAAGYQFMAAKFDLQKKVLTNYLDLALMEEKIRIQRDNVALLKMMSETASARVQAGGPQQDLLKAQMEWRLAENELANMEAQGNSMRSMLNGLMGRAGEALLVLPPTLPEARPLAADDAELIAVAVDQNPELKALASRVAGRQDALELAKMMYMPDISPTFSITGSVSQAIGAMVMLPTNLPVIRREIDEARAMLRSAEAEARQAGRERAGQFVGTLFLMRNAERQAAVFQNRIKPAAEQVLNSSRQAYTTGSVGFADLIDSQRTLLEVRQMIAESRIERERRLAELEALAGVDIETLGRAGSQAAVNATTQEVPAAAPTTTRTTPPTMGQEVR